MGSRAEGEERWTLYVCPVCGWAERADEGVPSCAGQYVRHERTEMGVRDFVLGSRFEEVQASNSGLLDAVERLNEGQDRLRVENEQLRQLLDLPAGELQKFLWAEAERDDLARLLDEAIEREKVSEAVIERVGIERQKVSADLERAQEALRVARERFDEIECCNEETRCSKCIATAAEGAQVIYALAEARERGEQ